MSKSSILLFIFFHLTVPALYCYTGDSTNSKKPFIDAFWVDGGPGISSLGFGGCAAANLIIGKRVIFSASKSFHLTFMKAMPESISDYYFSGGFLFLRSKDFILSGSGGLGQTTHKFAVKHLYNTSLFSGEFTYENKTSNCVPLNLRIIYLPNSSVQLGWNIFYNINEVKNYSGIMGTIGIGFIERERYEKTKLFPFHQ